MQNQRNTNLIKEYKIKTIFITGAGGFLGSDKIIKQIQVGPKKIRVGIKPEGRLIAREKSKLFNESNLPIGEITSGTFGPSVNGPIAMGYIHNEFSKNWLTPYLCQN